MRSLVCAVSLGAIVGCSATFSPQTCALDTDCTSGDVCELRDNTPVCVHASDATLTIGQSAPISGTNQALGTSMKSGVEIAFDEQNTNGGIRGRQLALSFRDDEYDPPTAEMAARAFTDVVVDPTAAPKCPSTALPEPDGHGNTVEVSTTAMTRGPDAVLALVGNVGTPTMLLAAPVAIETGTLYFGAFTGADKILRDTTAGDCAKYVFNVRAGYDDETQATMDLYKDRGLTGYQNLISFDQNDTFGDAGYSGLMKAYVVDYGAFPGTANQTTPIARFRYTRNDDTSVPAQITAAEQYLATLVPASGVTTVGVMMTDTYGAGAQFIQGIRQWQFDGGSPTGKDTRLKLYFSNISFVGPNALAEALVGFGTVPNTSPAMPFTQDVTVSQVVPNYQSDTSDIITDYNKAVAAAGQTPDYTSLEGYVDGRIFIAGLLAHTGPFTPDSLISSFENLPDLSLGIGANAGYSMTNHTYSQSVWGTSIEPDGSFTNLYFWTVGQTIQFFE